MQTTQQMTANLTVVEAFRLLKAGVPVFIASAPEATDDIRLRGAWKDDNGNIHYDYSACYLAKDVALDVARAFGQECILALYPKARGNGRVYLIKDTPYNRVIALSYAGGYTADGNYLITATDGFLPLVAVDVVAVKIDFPKTRIFDSTKSGQDGV